MSCDEDIYRWSQWLFLVLLEAGFIYDATTPRSTGATAAARCSPALQAEDGRCWRCHEAVRLVRRSQWFRGSAYAEENDRRLAELSALEQGRALAQRSVLGRVDGVELERPLDGEGFDALHAPRRRRRRGRVRAALAQPPGDRALDDRRRACASSSTSCAGGLAARRPQARGGAVVETGLSVFGAVGADPLPVLISPSVDARFGPTAVLGIPCVDETDAAIAARGAEAGGGAQRRLGAARRRPAPDRRSASAPRTSRSRASAPGARRSRSSTATPAGRCRCRRRSSRCASPRPEPTGEGNALVELARLRRVECPRCGGPAQRETDTLDCHFDAALAAVPAAGPARGPGRLAVRPPRAPRWVPVEWYINGADTGNFVLDQRTSPRCCATSATSPSCRTASPSGLPLPRDGEPTGAR